MHRVSHHPRYSRYLGNVLRLLLIVGLGALLFILRYFIKTPQPLKSPLAGKARLYKWRHGHIFYNVLGNADYPPLVLLHSPGIATSAYDMRQLLEGLAQHYQVYALDLLGFGLSDHPDIAYSGATYVELVRDFLAEVVKRPATLLASGLSCNYSAAAAAQTTELVERLILLSPVLLFGNSRPRFAGLLGLPLIGFVLYAILSTRLMLRWVVAQQRMLDANEVTGTDLDYYFAATHQPGAHHAAIAFIAGHLAFDTAQEFETLPMPILILWGARALNRSHAISQLHSMSAQTQVALIRDAGLSLQEERPQQVLANILNWRTENTPVREITTSKHESTVASGAVVDKPVHNEAATDTTQKSAVPSVNTAEVASEEAANEVTPALTIEAYCIKCRHKRIMLEPREVVTRNGQPAMQGTCPVCGTKLSRFLAR